MFPDSISIEFKSYNQSAFISETKSFFKWKARTIARKKLNIPCQEFNAEKIAILEKLLMAFDLPATLMYLGDSTFLSCLTTQEHIHGKQ